MTTFIRISRLLRNATKAAPGISEFHNKLLLTLSSPSQTYFIKEPIDTATLPGVEGAFTITNNYRQSVTQLKPGVIVVRKPSEEPKNYFITNGFLFFNSPVGGTGCCTAEVSGIEIVPLEALSKDKATQVLNELVAAPKETEWDKARAILASLDYAYETLKTSKI